MNKYKVTQEFMDSLKEWNSNHKYTDGTTLINQYTLNDLQEDVTEWLFETGTTLAERNRRLGAVINWINGEDVFEIGNPKYIVKRKGINFLVGNEYLSIDNYTAIHITRNKEKATIFDDFNKASEWANAHFKVVEVDE